MRINVASLVVLVLVLALQVYTSFLRGRDLDDVIADSDRAYQNAVFDNSDNKGVMHQVFRQNEADRELLKVLLQRCGR